MTVLLDTAVLPRHERLDAFHAVYAAESPSRTVRVAAHPVKHRAERVVLGRDVHLLRTLGTPMHVLRTPRQVRRDEQEYVAIGLRHTGAGLVTAGDDLVALPPGELNCVDMTRPYQLVHSAPYVHDVLVVSNDRLGLSVDDVRAAVETPLGSSPAYGLVRAHLKGLFVETSGMRPEVRASVGDATLALVRTLLATVRGSGELRESPRDLLVARVQRYVDAHLGDHDLTVERIAAVHHVSVRHLYAVWRASPAQESPGEWIVRRRLERARQRLVAEPWTSIASVAHDHGFVDPSHFSRRFRQAYGMTPREWRGEAR